jgi:hypothetical protein
LLLARRLLLLRPSKPDQVWCIEVHEGVHPRLRSVYGDVCARRRYPLKRMRRREESDLYLRLGVKSAVTYRSMTEAEEDAICKALSGTDVGQSYDMLSFSVAVSMCRL